MDATHEITVTVKGPLTTNDRGYENRDTLATFAVPTSATDAWEIYQMAVARAVSPRFEVALPREEFAD